MSEFRLGGLEQYTTQQIWDELKTRFHSAALLTIASRDDDNIRTLWWSGHPFTIIGFCEIMKAKLIAYDLQDSQPYEGEDS